MNTFPKKVLEWKRKMKYKNIHCIFDMDGVLAEYQYGEGDAIINNIDGAFLNKRPLYSIIDKVIELSKTPYVETYIISSCFSTKHEFEKNTWLNQHLPCIKQENRYYSYCRSFTECNEKKISLLKKIIDQKSPLIIIDDEHEVLRQLKNYSSNILLFHISSLID